MAKKKFTGTIFTGTPGNDTADADGTWGLPGSIAGFTPNRPAKLVDSTGDKFFGLAGNDQVSAGPGGDIIKGGSGGDTLRGNGGNDHVYGGNGADLLVGGVGNDVLKGGSSGSGVDSLFGGDGNDRLVGGRGQDGLFGEAGADKFVFKTAHDTSNDPLTADAIQDFNSIADQADLAERDRIDLRDLEQAIHHNLRFLGNDVDLAKFGIIFVSTTERVLIDTDGKSDIDMVIDLSGGTVTSLAKGDFIL
jgi:Ca2+-binding RTX toxin-like protein